MQRRDVDGLLRFRNGNDLEPRIPTCGPIFIAGRTPNRYEHAFEAEGVAASDSRKRTGQYRFLRRLRDVVRGCVDNAAPVSEQAHREIDISTPSRAGFPVLQRSQT